VVTTTPSQEVVGEGGGQRRDRDRWYFMAEGGRLLGWNGKHWVVIQTEGWGRQVPRREDEARQPCCWNATVYTSSTLQRFITSDLLASRAQ
jgi:hypothetical protein